MTTAGVPPPPRWDGHRLIFELHIDDAVVVRCAISRRALADVSGGGPFRTTDLMSRFAGARHGLHQPCRIGVKGSGI